ncbi:putative TnpA family transposase (plasmid) [Methylibium petroleiphilum PM1]|uniref:Putative TnpA family transposase n=1 Tax=Methylibium petroleiphilum (strain ATCC BAA-1232 / LMG 22953 / PM1) TaxID=420662 RepID=A2SMQ9_METPP|nr:putative TnpA family transposase [Methylibium petroleiphilum PM1]ABM97337.1 putative TnpA family transposase [Methylibium petroleiphilum PM1]
MLRATGFRGKVKLIARRRGDGLRLGLALHIGFVRMTGRPLNSVRVVPSVLLAHLGRELGIETPDLASVRALYARGRTLFDHQQLACESLGFGWMTEHQRRALVRVLRDEVAQCADRERLIVHARQWLYSHRLLVLRERDIRGLVAAALSELERTTAEAVRQSVPVSTLKRWSAVLDAPRPDGQPCQSWLWSAPAKHSTRQIAEVLERITCLKELGVDRALAEINNVLVRRYARRMASRAPSVNARVKEPARTVETACFLRYCLLTATDQFILMFQRRVADLWRQCADDAVAPIDWSRQYQLLLQELAELARDEAGTAELRTRLLELVAARRAQRTPSRASGIRRQLIAAIAPVRSLLVAAGSLSWTATGEHPALQALDILRAQYAAGDKTLPVDVTAARLGAAWRQDIADTDRERAFRALEVATLFALRRGLRNGSIWIEHSLSFRGRERLFIPDERWEVEARRHYARLQMPAKAANYLAPLLERVRAGVDAVATAVRTGALRVDDELHLAPLAADDEDPEVSRLRSRLDQRIGEVQLPEVILAVDAQVRFSWIMLAREPRSGQELLMVYAGILAHGTSLTAAECARMIPQLSATSIRQAMRWAGDERRLALACQAVLEHMQRQPIAATWGRADLASSDMMSLETSRRVWQARQDPRRQTASIGIYSHVKDRWGIFHAQPIVLNERQAGAAIEGVVRQEKVETTQLAVDTHGYTDFAMGLARLLGFDLCPRLRELNQRHLFVPRGMKVPEEIAAVCEATIDTALIETHWDSLVHLAASVITGHASAVTALARFGSAARGDPIYDAGVQLGKLLRTAFLADYFVNEAFRRELRRVLNRGEAVNALKRAIYTGRVGPAQARRADEMQAVADALSLLANIVMAWNTAQMQVVLDRWANRRQIVPAELTGRIAPTRLEGINLRGVFRFPLERYAGQILPSQTAVKTGAAG